MFETMKARLQQRGIGLRAGTASNLYYATARTKGGSDKSYVIRIENGKWICSPLSDNNTVEAARILGIALGEIRDERD